MIYEGKLPILEAWLGCIEGLVCGGHDVAEGHQSVLDHPSKLNCHDQDEGDHEESPDGLQLQVVHLDIHHVPRFPHIGSPADSQHLLVCIKLCYV